MTMRRISLIVFVVALALLPQLPVPEFWITQANYIGLYTLVAIGLVLLTGVAGLTSFGQAAFVGLLESFGSFYASAFKEVIVFTLIIPVLLWRSFQHGHHDEEE